MNAAKRIADVAHKTVVVGLFGGFAYTAANITGAMVEGQTGRGAVKKQEHPQSGFIQMLKDKAEEEYKKYYKIDHREWYDKDDDSYLKQVPKPADYAPKNN
mmetsp:Transcript_9634/g.14191  ORF Transcript_9634/g.14191 Transcript_9634/m.14191 type:complete len:101 (+) Transcript_9634:154-456(+)|eukprot:CAMPEP_0197239994 /NCGR_PEP_ID=MMETSP1429-20130617/6374_1 /TAXON_ID=49237 /ORGANISM="Chaetoceros  sp., Strain UNC1202" /LENGTH=100 /DNA_ID=CAMNT_0042699549 /DNA_START=81 /DNA_END=383 /DNA_ORIENTATION=+